MEKQKFHSNKQLSQAQLMQLGYDIVDNFEQVISYFNLDLRKWKNMYIGKCPIHGGDNPEAFNFYTDGHSNRGNWVCNTKGCQNTFRNSPIGFIRGLLSHVYKNWTWEFPSDDTVSFGEAIGWCIAFSDNDVESLKLDEETLEKREFVRKAQAHVRKYGVSGINRAKVRNSGLLIPASYYLEPHNGTPSYPKDILDKYDVGFCNNPAKKFYKRVVVPVYDESHNFMVGATARSVFDKCGKCRGHHSPERNCPKNDKGELIIYPKWRHSPGFNAEDHLYNYWYSAPFIKKTGVIVVVESPGNVWRLEEAGIHNSVAVFGTSLKEGQKELLDKSGALCILVIGDNDDGGDILVSDVQEKCDNLYNVIGIKPETVADIGAMKLSEIKPFIAPHMAQLDIYGEYLNS